MGSDLSLLVKRPFAWNLFVVLESDLDSLFGVDADFLEVEVITGHCEFGDSEISDKVNHITWSTLDINWYRVLDFSEFSILSCSVHNVE